MVEFYDINLFSKPIKIKGFLKDFYTICQIYINVSGRYFRAVILQEGQDKSEILNGKYIISGFDIEKKILMPLFDDEYVLLISSLHSSMKNISKGKLISQIIDYLFINLESLCLNDSFGLKYITCDIYASISSLKPILRTHEISIQITPEYQTTPFETCFWAEDGINQNVFIKITKSDFEYNKIKAYHLLDEVKIFLCGDIIHSFSCTDIRSSNDIILMLLQGYLNDKLGNSIVSKLSYSNLSIYDATYFLLKQAGIPDKIISFVEQQKKLFYWYTIYIPIREMIITEEFGIGNVTFLNRSHKEIEEFAQYINNNTSYNGCFAKVHINEKNFYDAYINGKDQISRALDLLLNLIRDDSSFANHSTDNILVERNKKWFYPKPREDEWVYIINTFNNKKIITKTENLFAINSLVVSKEIINIIENCEYFEEKIIDLANKSDDNLEPLFNSLKWIRKAWESNDNDDRIIYSIIALEFVVSNEKGQPLLEKKLKSELIKKVEENLKVLMSDLDESVLPDKINKIKEKLNFTFNDTPFMVKLEGLISRLNIHVSKKDIELIKKAREKRNDIVHGRKSQNMLYEEVWKLCEIVSLVTFTKIKSLGDKK